MLNYIQVSNEECRAPNMYTTPSMVIVNNQFIWTRNNYTTFRGMDINGKEFLPSSNHFVPGYRTLPKFELFKNNQKYKPFVNEYNVIVKGVFYWAQESSREARTDFQLWKNTCTGLL